MKYSMYVKWAKQCIADARRHMTLAKSYKIGAFAYRYWMNQSSIELRRANWLLKLSNGQPI